MSRARSPCNPGWNTGVDYRRQLMLATERPLVLAAYREAGLDLGADLDRLGAAARVPADASAVSWLSSHGTLIGRGARW
ncbi:hypothetical protein FKR81_10665 [Lentzea tibetensis]|uniref:Uncharacterized protein n=1 Tax=Lentzea tibetensis TaxID=2591470 RepID=A0A563EWL0_9PSEU|nr:hypothetical protein [Lentzea tibetensis]TWP52043.1 hypothetical protein FKR81_10665 [Lentzea tibetensis]